jgi:hypothetical protein
MRLHEFSPGLIWARQWGSWGISNGVAYPRPRASCTVAHYTLLHADTNRFVQAHKMQTLYLFNFVFVNRAQSSEVITYIHQKYVVGTEQKSADNRGN